MGDDAEPVKRAALGYLQFVLSEELPAMRRRGSVADNLVALRTLGLLAPSLTASAPLAVQTVMLQVLLPYARRGWSASHWPET